MKQQTPDFGASMAAVDWGRSLVMLTDGDADAWPWLRLLELAGVPVARIRDGRYAFTFAGRPDLTEAGQSTD